MPTFSAGWLKTLRYVKQIGDGGATAIVIVGQSADATGRVPITVEVEVPAVIAYGQMSFLASPGHPLVGLMAAGSVKAAQRIAALLQISPY